MTINQKMEISKEIAIMKCFCNKDEIKEKIEKALVKSTYGKDDSPEIWSSIAMQLWR